jgi:hypothetical protein
MHKGLDITKKLIVGWVFLGIWISACAAQPTPVPTVELLPPAATRPSASVTAMTTFPPSLTPRPTGTATRVSTVISATDTPASIPAPLSPYPTADGSLPLSDGGPWLAYAMTSWCCNSAQVAVVNADGSGRQVLDANAWSLIGDPSGPFLALLSQSPEYFALGADTLLIAQLPGMSVKTIPLAASPAIESFDYRSLDYPQAVLDTEAGLGLIHMATSYWPPAWSPDGRTLAFTAAIDGPTADLYVYDTRSDQIRRLSAGFEMATRPIWSPDGKWIVYRGVTNVGGAGCDESGVWAAAPDGSQVKLLTPGECFIITRWTGPETFETFTPPSGGAAPDDYLGAVRRVDIAAGTSTLLDMEPGPYHALPPAVDCLTQKAIDQYKIKNNSTRIASPDGKWFVVANDHLRLFTMDGRLVDEFSVLDQFVGWQPGSNTALFTTLGEAAHRRTLQYFQPEDRSSKIYKDILPAAAGFPDQVVWRADSPKFFLLVSSSQELVSIDPLAGTFNKVDQLTGNNQDWKHAWVGAGTLEDQLLRVPCYAGQP